MQMMSGCSASIASIRKAGPATSAATVRSLLEAFRPFRVHMAAHLQEEEDVGLPLMRHLFTAKELKPVEAQIIKDATPDDLAWVVRPLGSVQAKRDWMTQVAGVPGPVQTLVMMPAVRKRDARCVVPMKALGAGATEAPPAEPGCACSVM